MGAHPQINDWVVVPELPDLFQRMERKILTMEKLRAKLKENSGFTLIEMLIVVAIIAILIAVSIPMVNGALERARDSADQANERAAKAITTLYFMGATDDTIAGGGTYEAGSAMSSTTPIYYDTVSGNLTFEKPTDGYGQCTNHDSCYQNGGNATDYDISHVGKVIRVEITTEGVFSAHWV